jgi:hypothetical protein
MRVMLTFVLIAAALALIFSGCGGPAQGVETESEWSLATTDLDPSATKIPLQSFGMCSDVLPRIDHALVEENAQRVVITAVLAAPGEQRCNEDPPPFEAELKAPLGSRSVIDGSGPEGGPGIRLAWAGTAVLSCLRRAAQSTPALAKSPSMPTSYLKKRRLLEKAPRCIRGL